MNESKGPEIRLLNANEIDVRVQSVSKTRNGTVGAVLLLYKDARVDMKILDEVFGIYGWKRSHELINGNLFCTISIRDKETGEWISKQDVGVESNTEKEKGQASDAFKRAGFNIGIGRELYTAPFIWLSYRKTNITRRMSAESRSSASVPMSNSRWPISSIQKIVCSLP